MGEHGVQLGPLPSQAGPPGRGGGSLPSGEGTRARTAFGPLGPRVHLPSTGLMFDAC